MRPHLLALALPLLLAACQSQPASEAPPANPPAAEAPAQPAAPADAETAPLFGSWAVDPANCGTPITISATRFEGAENLCDITSLEASGDGFTASLTCTSQGQTSSEKISMTPLFGPQGEGIRLQYVDRGGDPVTVFRCD